MTWEGENVDTGWRVVGAAGQPAFQNGWTQYDLRTARFRRRHGIVFLDGIVANGTSGTVVFYLPIGFRPRNAGIYDILLVTCTSAGNGNLGIAGTDGRVVVVGGTGWAYITCSFLAEG